jgi:hypothetical protein
LAIKYLDAKRIRALSTDTLPTNVPTNTIAEITDNYSYRWYDGTLWNPVPIVFTYGNILGATGDQDLFNKITIATTANASNIGSVRVNLVEPGYGTSDGSRGIVGTGWEKLSIEYFTIATGTTTLDFGDVIVFRAETSNLSDMTYAAFCGGSIVGWAFTDLIDYVTIQTTGDAADFGDLTVARAYTSGGSDFFGDSGKGWIIGGSSNSNIMEYIVLATTGDATDYGDLSVGSSGSNSMESETRVCIASTGGYTNAITYWSMASSSTTGDFGDLAVAVGYCTGGITNKTRGVIHGGNLPSGAGRVDSIEYITIATTGNATDFGDMSDDVYGCASTSGT